MSAINKYASPLSNSGNLKSLETPEQVIFNEESLVISEDSMDQIESMDAILKVAEGTLAAGSSVLSHTLDSVPHPIELIAGGCGLVRSGIGLATCAQHFWSGEETGDPCMDGLLDTKAVLNGVSSVVQPMLFLEEVGVYTLGEASQALGCVQIGFGIGLGTVGLTIASCQLSDALQQEQSLRACLEKFSQKAQLNDDELLVKKYLEDELEKNQTSIKEKIWTLVQRIIEIVASFFSAIAAFILPMVFIPIAAIFEVISLSIGCSQCWCKDSDSHDDNASIPVVTASI